MNSSAVTVGEEPPSVVTTTSAAPPVPGGEVAAISVPDTTVNDVAGTPPKVTAAAPERLLPVIVTAVPPATGPELGLTAKTDGVANVPGAASTYAAPSSVVDPTVFTGAPTTSVAPEVAIGKVVPSALCAGLTVDAASEVVAQPVGGSVYA